jgi:hypothetical protein
LRINLSDVSFGARECGQQLAKRFNAKIVWWFVLIVICTHFCLAYVQNDQPFLNLGDYIQGTCRLPYQYRVLMAWVLREGLRIPGLTAISARLPQPVRDPRGLILFVTSWVSIFGSVLFTWRSLTRLTKNEQYSRWASLLVLYMAYFQFPLVFGLDFFLPYDLPSLLFFCACLYCVISRRMLLFYLFFVVGTFNRETICMATLFLAIWGWEESKGREDTLALAGHVLTQAVIWIVIKLYLHHLFAGNLAETGGATFYYKLGYNLRIFLKPWEWPVLLSVFGFTLPLVLAWRKWMRNAAMENEIYLLAAWFVVMMMVGVVIEIRVFSELIGYMALAVGLILYHRFPALQTAEPSSPAPRPYAG